MRFLIMIVGLVCLAYLAWHYRIFFYGVPFAIVHLILIGIVVKSCLHDLKIPKSSWRDDDIGAVSDKIGWGIVFIIDFPFSILIAALWLVLSPFIELVVMKFNISKGNSRNLMDASSIYDSEAFIRIWVPMILFGVFGTIWWYSLPLTNENWIVVFLRNFLNWFVIFLKNIINGIWQGL